MNKDEIIKYIREYDPFFLDANLEHYTFHELMLMKTSIDIEKEKNFGANFTHQVMVDEPRNELT